MIFFRICLIFTSVIIQFSSATILGPVIPSLINSTCKSANPGDTILITGGTYSNTGLLSIDSCKGIASKYISIQAEKNKSVVFTGKITISLNSPFTSISGILINGSKTTPAAFGNIVQLSALGSRLTNSVIDGISGTNNIVYVTKAGSHARIDHNTFSNKNGPGRTVEVEAKNDMFVNVDHNYFYNRIAGTSNGWETIRLGLSFDQWTTPHHIVEHNLFEKCNGETELISIKCSGTIIRYNTIIDSTGSITGRHGGQHSIISNYFIKSNGIRLTGTDDIVANNYFQQSQILIHRGDHFSSKSVQYGYIVPQNALIAHNTFVNNKGSDIERQQSCRDCVIIADNVKLVNNLHYNSGITVASGPGKNEICAGNLVFNSAKNATISSCVNGFIVADPVMTLDSNNILRIGSTSAARKKAIGQWSALLPTDRNGYLRPTNTSADIGSEQYTTTPANFPRLFPSDVGPQQLILSKSELVQTEL